MKSAWPVVLVTAAVALLPMAEAKSDEPGNEPPAADPMRGKEAGQVRDDNGMKMKLVWCPPGAFTMGSPKSEKDRNNDEDQVGVTLTRGYWLGQYEVTQSEWKRVMSIEPWKGKTLTKEGDDFPATWVSWRDATDFCRRLTEQERQAGHLPDNWEYALPTEAQWERTCRAGTETKYSFGDDESKLGDYAWFENNAWYAREHHYAHQIGQKKANPWGLCNMHGNVWEWCRDVYAEKLSGGRDPVVKSDEETEASVRVVRGGSWISDAASCRSGYRNWGRPVSRLPTVSFRVALSAVR